VILGDSLSVVDGLSESSVDLIVADPPYHKVKGEAWDNQWKTDSAYLEWVGRVLDGWKRVLKPNGSLYCFASNRMAWAVEGAIRDRFFVLNVIRWVKADGWAKRQCKEAQRAFFPASESVIFAEHFGADNMANGEAGYAAKCDELRGFVFEPIRAYIDGERKRAGFSLEDCSEACGFARSKSTEVGRHYFSRSQWHMPTPDSYEKLRDAFNRSVASGGEFFLRREYEELRREYEELRREYEELRREYEELRRPFTVTVDVPYTDVWQFPTVGAYKGKHPCEKPADLIRHVVTASSRPGATVLDPFAGSGVTGEVCAAVGRKCLLVERDAGYHAKILDRLNVPRPTSEPFAAPQMAVGVSTTVRTTWRHPTLFDVFAG
jgi:site-specific DNA-methyltransferase (adenine-specific)